MLLHGAISCGWTPAVRLHCIRTATRCTLFTQSTFRTAVIWLLIFSINTCFVSVGNYSAKSKMEVCRFPPDLVLECIDRRTLARFMRVVKRHVPRARYWITRAQ